MVRAMVDVMRKDEANQTHFQCLTICQSIMRLYHQNCADGSLGHSLLSDFIFIALNCCHLKINIYEANIPTTILLIVPCSSMPQLLMLRGPLRYCSVCIHWNDILCISYQMSFLKLFVSHVEIHIEDVQDAFLNYYFLFQVKQNVWLLNTGWSALSVRSHLRASIQHVFSVLHI